MERNVEKTQEMDGQWLADFIRLNMTGLSIKELRIAMECLLGLIDYYFPSRTS